MSQKSYTPRGVFDDFSFSAVAASALTAATSFLLTSKIGLAGSLIGAMVAAVISTVSTQVYKGMLTASADRIKEVAEPTIVFGQHAAPETRFASTAAHEIAQFARRLVVFAVCVSLAAVVASAALIAFATRGAGLGPTTWEPVTVVEEAKETVSEVKDDAAAVADKVDSKVDELVAEDDAKVGSAINRGESVTSSKGSSSVSGQESAASSEAASAAEETPVEETTAEQEQPLTGQGLPESGEVSSADVVQ